MGGKNRSAHIFWSLAAMGAMLGGCDEHVPLDLTGPITIELTVLEGELGTEEAPLAVTQRSEEGPDRVWPERTFTLHARALLANGAVDTSFARRVHVRVIPGQISGEEWIDLPRGEADIDITVTKIFGPTRIWVEDIGEDGQGSYATGVTPEIHVEYPRISDIQYVPADETCVSPNGETLDAYECASLTGDFVHIEAASRLLVVTEIVTQGFYVTDCTDGMGLENPCDVANGNYNSMFAFNFSAPKDVAAGDVLTSLAGNVTEFYGSTQLSFPQWTVDPDLKVPPPEPQLMDEATFCNDDAGLVREAYESDLVRLEHLVVKDFADDANDLDGYREHDQWPAIFADTLNSSSPCEVMVISSATIPDFDPLAYPGLELDYVQGSFTTYASEYSDYFIWTVQPRSPDDLGCAGGTCSAN